jgi:hypothetical protein
MILFQFYFTVQIVASLFCVALIEFGFFLVLNLRPCQHGIPLPGEITWRLPMSVDSVVAVIYSFVPYAIGLASLVGLWISRTTSSFIFVGVGISLVVLNELIIKRIPGIAQARPFESCLLTNGMPSSHGHVGNFCLLVF